MKSSLHIIRKQTLQFQYNGNADGFALQKEVSDWCNFTLIPEIELQIDLLDLGDNSVSIDKLEIEATVNTQDWKQTICDDLIFSLKQKLSNYKLNLNEPSDKVESRLEKLDELILFYFGNGYIPWWGKALIEDNDFETVLQNWIVEEMSYSRAEYVSEKLKHIVSKNVIERIIIQVPQKLYFLLLKNIYKEVFELISQLESFFEEVILDNIFPEKEKLITKTLYRHLLKIVIKNKGEFSSHSILPFLYKELKTLNVSAKILKPQRDKIGIQANLFKQAWQELLINESIELKNKTKNESPSLKVQTQEEVEPEEITNAKQLQYNKLIDRLVNLDTIKKGKDELVAELQEGIYIDNAGAVIFAAFIPALFNKLAIEKDGVILNPDLAALIIQYCVTGRVNIAEYELVLSKILCGLDIKFPVNTNLKISDEQMREVDEMLLSLIEYWSVLQNTSIEGLRESFLKRSGKLSMINSEWLLLVDQKSYDILLERIPWSISMIKLPWMKNLLKTEWV